MTKAVEKKSINVQVEANAKGQLKRIGGSSSDKWNNHIADLTFRAMPDLDLKNRESAVEKSIAVCQAAIDINPTDPIEGILIGQIMAANEASMACYRKAWAQPPEYFDARTRYLQLADKTARTVSMLSERLDAHRNRGQQQIVVKHVTVNAENAMVADSITTGSPVLDAAKSDRPMKIVDQVLQPELVGAGVGSKSK